MTKTKTLERMTIRVAVADRQNRFCSNNYGLLLLSPTPARQAGVMTGEFSSSSSAQQKRPQLLAEYSCQ